MLTPSAPEEMPLARLPGWISPASAPAIAPGIRWIPVAAR